MRGKKKTKIHLHPAHTRQAYAGNPVLHLFVAEWTAWICSTGTTSGLQALNSHGIRTIPMSLLPPNCFQMGCKSAWFCSLLCRKSRRRGTRAVCFFIAVSVPLPLWVHNQSDRVLQTSWGLRTDTPSSADKPSVNTSRVTESWVTAVQKAYSLEHTSKTGWK